MGVVKEERDALDRVLRRYLSSGTPEALLAEATAGWSAFDEHTVTANGNGAPPAATPLAPSTAPARLRAARRTRPVDEVQGVQRFCVSPDRSAVLIEARSTVGPITFGAIGIVGWIETTVGDGALEPGEHTRAHLEIALERLASGNRLYDAELLRRIDARRHPLVTLDLDAVTPIGPPERFALVGSIEFHGVRRQLQGTVVASMPNARDARDTRGTRLRHPRLRHLLADGVDVQDLSRRDGETAARGGARRLTGKAGRMKMLFVLAAGYVLGATAGSRDFDELFDSVRAIRDSEEFDDFLSALRSHASHTLRELADMLERVGPEAVSSNDLVERVKQIAVRG